MKGTKGISGVYQIINKVNGKIYIGSAVNLKKRWKEHKWELVRNGHYNKYLQRSWNKYGEESFEFVILLYCRKEDLLHHEQLVIDKYKSAQNKNGYNLAPTAGSTLGMKGQIPWNKGKTNVYSEETKNRMREALKGMIPWNKGMTGFIAWNKGKKLSKEGCLKLSLAHLGYDMPQEQRDKISETLKNHLKLNEHWNKGFKHSEKTKQKIASFQKGRIRSEETKLRMSKSKKGHIVSEMTRRKISETKREAGMLA